MHISKFRFRTKFCVEPTRSRYNLILNVLDLIITLSIPSPWPLRDAISVTTQTPQATRNFIASPTSPSQPSISQSNPTMTHRLKLKCQPLQRCPLDRFSFPSPAPPSASHLCPIAFACYVPLFWHSGRSASSWHSALRRRPICLELPGRGRFQNPSQRRGTNRNDPLTKPRVEEASDLCLC